MNIFNTQRKNISRKGFTLIETLVAISILVVGVGAVFTAVQSGLSNSSSVRQRMIAMYLAEEGINGIKNLKDSNLTNIASGNSSNWLQGIQGICSANNPCAYDITAHNGNGGVVSCAGNPNNCRVRLDTISIQGDEVEIYKQGGGGTDTGFVREIYVEETNSGSAAGREAKVTVEITRPNTNTPDLKVVQYIYNYWP